MATRSRRRRLAKQRRAAWLVLDQFLRTPTNPHWKRQNAPRLAMEANTAALDRALNTLYEECR